MRPTTTLRSVFASLATTTGRPAMPGIALFVGDGGKHLNSTLCGRCDEWHLDFDNAFRHQAFDLGACPKEPHRLVRLTRNCFAVSQHDGRIFIADIARPDRTPLFLGRHSDPSPAALAVSADGTRLFSRSFGLLRAWNV